MAIASPPAPHAGFQLAWRIAGAMFCRLVLNTARRFVYPFAPVISRELDVPLTAVTAMVAACQAAPLVGLISGPFADRWGYRRMMIGGLALVALGMSAAAIWPTYAVLTLAVVLASFGKTIYDPAIQAYVGARVPFERRGLVIGLLEFPWAGSTLIAIPLIGLLMDAGGWRMAPLSLAVAAMIGLLLMTRLFDPDSAPSVSTSRMLGTAWGALVARPEALGALGFAFFASAANDMLFIVYGAWLEGRFGLGLAALGLSTVVIGGAELLGEGLTVVAADRLGIKRAALLGAALTMIAYALLPVVGESLSGALIGLFAVFVAFEFTIVNCMSLATELLPGHRATMMSGFFVAAGLGRVCGALLGVPIWQSGGIGSVGLTAAAATLIALLCLNRGLARWAR
ncbi:MAG: MFS transporter [Desulfobacterales bacterium]|jgi:predicted MFS family arabinose efflux permease|nr:MFS transporter [Desulfobacterales bacterium]